MIRWLVLCGLAVAPLAAHIVSMSTGQVEVDGARVHYRLSIPEYETQHIRHPEEALLEQIHFASAGEPARLVEKSCKTEQPNYVCDAVYGFTRPVETLEVTCTYPSLGIPTHVHILRATRGEFTAQAAFDSTFTHTELRFRPPTPAEEAARQLAFGFFAEMRGVGTVLILLALALGSRGARRGTWTGTILLASSMAAWTALHISRWQAELRFGEAAAALAAAYAAFELALLPQAQLALWIAAGCGALQAVRWAPHMAAAQAEPAWFLTGALTALAVEWGLFATLGTRLAPWLDRKRLRRPLACAVLITALAWFVLQIA